MIYQTQILFFSFQNILQKKLKIIQKNGIFQLFKKGYINSSTPVSIQNFNLVDYKTKKINFGNAFFVFQETIFMEVI